MAASVPSPPPLCDSISIAAATTATNVAARAPPPSRRPLACSTCSSGAADSCLRRRLLFSAGGAPPLGRDARHSGGCVDSPRRGGQRVGERPCRRRRVRRPLADRRGRLCGGEEWERGSEGEGAPDAGPVIAPLVESAAAAPSAPRLMPLARRPRPRPSLPTCCHSLHGWAGARSCSGCPCHQGGLRGAYPTSHVAAVRAAAVAFAGHDRPANKAVVIGGTAPITLVRAS